MADRSYDVSVVVGAVDNASPIFSRFVVTLGDVERMLSRLTAATWDMVKAAGEEELLTVRLANAMQIHGQYTKKAFEENVAFAKSIQEVTVYADDQILATEQLLTTLGLGTDQMREATLAATNLASGLGLDLHTATMLVGKAFQGHTETLARYGIAIDKNIPETKKFGEVLRVIGENMGGMARGEAETFNGKMAQLKNSFEDLKEAIGGKFLPVLKDFVDVLRDGTKEMQKAAPAAEAYYKMIIDNDSQISKATGMTALQRAIQGVADISAKAGAQLATLIGRASDEMVDSAVKAGKMSADAVIKSNKDVLDNTKSTYAAGTRAVQVELGNRDRYTKAELEGVKRAEEKIARDITNMHKQQDREVSASFKMAMNQMIIDYQTFGTMWTGFFSELHASTKQSFVDLITNIQDGFSSFDKFIGSLWDGMKKAFINIVAEMATRWVMSHGIMQAATLIWKGIEVAASAAVAAARAAAAYAWTLWGAIALGASIGLAVLAFKDQFATGVDNYYGGMALVGERGPELVNLPLGSSVYSNSRSAAMMAAGSGQQTIVVNVSGNYILDNRQADALAERVGTAILRKVRNERNV